MGNVIDKNGCVYHENDKRVKKNPGKFKPAPVGTRPGKCYIKHKTK